VAAPKGGHGSSSSLVESLKLSVEADSSKRIKSSKGALVVEEKKSRGSSIFKKTKASTSGSAKISISAASTAAALIASAPLPSAAVAQITGIPPYPHWFYLE